MEFDFYFDYDINKTHIEKHNVSAKEIWEFFNSKYFQRRRRDGSFIAIGRTSKERYLEVIYRKKKDFFFIITAYDLEDIEKIDYINRKLEGL